MQKSDEKKLAPSRSDIRNIFENDSNLAQSISASKSGEDKKSDTCSYSIIDSSSNSTPVSPLNGNTQPSSDIFES